MRNLNIVGPQVRRLRNERGWTQSRLATFLQVAGWDISRVGLAKIEAQLVWVGDHQLLRLAAVLKVELKDLYPPMAPGVKMHDHLERKLRRWRPAKK